MFWDHYDLKKRYSPKTESTPHKHYGWYEEVQQFNTDLKEHYKFLWIFIYG
jgi:hypothetical protein